MSDLWAGGDREDEKEEMLSRRGANALFIVLMCVIMSGAVALAMALVTSGLTRGLLWQWTRGWAIGTLVAVPVAFLIVPPLERFCKSLTK